MWRVARQELRHHKWSLLAFCVGSISVLAMYVVVYPSLQSSSEQLAKSLNSLPPALLKAFDITDLNFNTLEKLLGSKQFNFIWPILAISLILSRAGGSIAGEIEKGTMGLLLALPLARWRIFAAKYFAGLFTLLVFGVVSILGTIPVAAALNVDYNTATLLNIFWLGLLFMWAVYGCSMLVSSWFSESSKVYALVSGVLVVMYVMEVTVLLKPDWDIMQYFTIFYYFNVTQIADGANIMARSIWVLLAVGALSSVAAVWRFSKRDVQV